MPADVGVIFVGKAAETICDGPSGIGASGARQVAQQSYLRGKFQDDARDICSARNTGAAAGDNDPGRKKPVPSYGFEVSVHNGEHILESRCNYRIHFFRRDIAARDSSTLHLFGFYRRAAETEGPWARYFWFGQWGNSFPDS